MIQFVSFIYIILYKKNINKLIMMHNRFFYDKINVLNIICQKYVKYYMPKNTFRIILRYFFCLSIYPKFFESKHFKWLEEKESKRELENYILFQKVEKGYHRPQLMRVPELPEIF